MGAGGGGGGGGGEPPPPPAVMEISAQFWNCSPVDPSQLDVCQMYWSTHSLQVTPVGSWNVYVAVVQGCWVFGTVWRKPLPPTLHACNSCHYNEENHPGHLMRRRQEKEAQQVQPQYASSPASIRSFRTLKVHMYCHISWTNFRVSDNRYCPRTGFCENTSND